MSSLSAIDLHRAAERLEGVAHRTPVMTSSTFDALTGARVLFKAECFQRVGAFKFRGAYNTLASLDAETRARGVVTHSSGNHAQAVALAARLFEVDAHIVMPENAPLVKRRAVEGYGGKVTLCAPSMEARETGAAEILQETGATLVHPYDDDRIIAGQATAARELIEQAATPLDRILVPVGGGGLAAGTALSCRYFSPACEVIGCEPAGADDAYRSYRSGRLQGHDSPPQTVADGLRGRLSRRTFEVIRNHLADLCTVEEDEILQAVRFVWERMKILIEPSAAVPVAALLSGKIPGEGKTVGIILSGGNVDLDALPRSADG